MQAPGAANPITKAAWEWEWERLKIGAQRGSAAAAARGQVNGASCCGIQTCPGLS